MGKMEKNGGHWGKMRRGGGGIAGIAHRMWVVETCASMWLRKMGQKWEEKEGKKGEKWDKIPIPHFSQGECLPGARPARYFCINYPDFSPRFTLPWRSPPSRPHCTAHLPYKARGKIKQYL